MTERDAATLRDILKEFHTAMLATHGGESGVHVRPMALADVEENCNLWFLTAEETPKVDELKSDQNVTVVCQGPTKFATVLGTATVVRDRAKIAALWKEPFRVWFPEGKDDPSLVLVRVKAQEGEYWDNRGFKGVKYLLEGVKAYVRGERPQISKEIHARVRLA